MPRTDWRGFRGYKEAIAWIAVNDSFRELDLRIIMKSPTVNMIAALSKHSVLAVANDVATIRAQALAMPRPQQDRAYDFIVNYITKNGRSPSLAEIAEALDVGRPKRAFEIVTSLVKRGLITKEPSMPRSIKLVER